MSGCVHCSGRRRELSAPFDGEYDDGSVSVELTRERGRWLLVATGYYNGGYICGVELVEIAYCPMCGRRLNEDGGRS